MRRITIKQMEYFIAVAEAGSFSAAAESLFVAQSSVSSAVKEMENEYNVLAFERGARGVSLTSAGQELYMEFKSLLNRLDYLKMSTEDAAVKKSLIVAAQHHICGIDSFIAVVNEIEDDSYRCGFHECSTTEMIERVSNKEADIGIIFFSMSSKAQMIKNIRNKGLIFNHLCYKRACVYLHRSHPLHDRAKVRLDELTEYPYVSYDRVAEEDPAYTNVFDTALMLNKIISVRDRASAYTILRYCQGFLVGSGFVPRDPSFEEIVAIPIATGLELEIGWISKGGSLLNKTTEQFVELLKQEVNPR